MNDKASEDAALRRVIGVGASAGGVEALLRLVRGLPADLGAAVLVVLHIPATGGSVLPAILARNCALPVRAAEDGEPLRAGEVLVAPPDCHLLAVAGTARLERGPKENGARPAVDPMLRSVAVSAGPTGVAVILSGALGDGADGAAAVAAAGGTVLVQDPSDAIVPSMPQRALQAVARAAHVLPALEIGAELGRLAAEPSETQEQVTMGNADTPLDESRERPDGPPTGLTCPECNGALWAVPEPSRRLRYRCRIGHAYSQDALVGAQGDRVEAALWTALELLEERVELLGRVADGQRADRARSSRRLREAAADALRRAELLREALAASGRRPHALGVDAEDLAG